MYEEVLHVDIVYYRGFWLPSKITVTSGYRTEITVVSGYRTEITVVASYHAKITVHYLGLWLPYKHYRGGQLP